MSAAREVAATTRSTAASLEQISDVLSGVGKGEWRGKAAPALRDLMDDEFAPKVQTAAQAFDGAARALGPPASSRSPCSSWASPPSSLHRASGGSRQPGACALARTPVASSTDRTGWLSSTPGAPGSCWVADRCQRCSERPGATGGRPFAELEVHLLQADEAVTLVKTYDRTGLDQVLAAAGVRRLG